MKEHYAFVTLYSTRIPVAGWGSAALVAIAAAMREQLGLKLEPANGAIEVLIIEGVERPR